MSNNLYEAYASNPRYHPDGLEGAIDEEEMNAALQQDAEASSIAKLDAMAKPEAAGDEIAPTPSDDTQKPVEAQKAPDERQTAIKTHETILSAVDTVTGPVRDVTAGMYKAFDNTLAFAVGRDNLDAGNEWMREAMPELADFTDQFSQGIAPRGTISAVTQEMSQFMVPFGLYMKGMGALAAANQVKAGIFAKSAIADIATSGSAMNPHMERFSGLMKSLGVDNRIVDWLADNEDETVSEGRLKNILDSAGAAALLAPAFITAALVFKGMWMARATLKGKPAPTVTIGRPASEVTRGQTSPIPTSTPVLKPPKIPETPKQMLKSPKSMGGK